MGGYSTYKNKQEMWNNDFSFEASFSKKSSLKVSRICVRLSNSELNRDNTITGYSMRKNKSNRAFSFEISISKKLTFSFSIAFSRLQDPALSSWIQNFFNLFYFCMKPLSSVYFILECWISWRFDNLLVATSIGIHRRRNFEGFPKDPIKLPLLLRCFFKYWLAKMLHLISFLSVLMYSWPMATW